MDDAEYLSSNFAVYRRGRVGSISGGVLIAINSDVIRGRVGSISGGVLIAINSDVIRGRVGSISGGVLIAINSDVISSRKENLESTFSENIWDNINIRGCKSSYVGVCYSASIDVETVEIVDSSSIRQVEITIILLRLVVNATLQVGIDPLGYHSQNHRI